MPRALSYLLVILVGIVAGAFATNLLWMNPVAAVLGMYAAGVILFLIAVDAVLSSEGVQGFFREVGEGGRHLATLLISTIASASAFLAVSLMGLPISKRFLGALLPLPAPGEHVVKAGSILLIPMITLAALFGIIAALEFWATRTRWWGRLRSGLTEGRRGQVGLVLTTALISAVIISLLRREVQLLAIVSIGVALYVLWLLFDRLLPNSRVWAVARHTVAEALHYKLVVAWVLVILLLVFALPPVISGDGATMKSRIQSYLEVSLSLIGGGLGLLTVGLSAFTLPNEILRKQIFMVASKPIPRWQILVGKWTGIGLLNAGLLLFSGAAVWGFAWYLRQEPTTYEDHMAIEQEVFKVRQDAKLEKPADLAARVEASVRKMREDGDLTEDRAEEVLKNRLEEMDRNWRSLAPRSGQTYTFKNLRVNPSEPDYLHIRLKPNTASGVDDLKFEVVWAAGDPKDPNTLMAETPAELPVKRATTLIVPARCVGSDGTLQFHLLNLSPRDTMIFEANEDLQLLYGFGTFHWNLMRTLAIIWCRLAFVSILGLFFSTFLDFPVAFVCTLLLFLIPLLSGFLVESLDGAKMRPDGKDPIWGPLKLGYVLVPVGQAVVFALPDFSKYDAAGNVVDGRYVPALWLVHAVIALVVGWCGVMGALGCALLTRRELARDGT